MRWIDGTSIDLARPGVANHLGQLIGAFQRNTTEILQSAPPDWNGRSRPTIRIDRDLDDAQAALRAAEFVTDAQHRRLDAVIQRIRARGCFNSATNIYLHNDFHAGNILQTNGPTSEGRKPSDMQTSPELVLIDFDDSAFGPAEMEWAQLRLHLRRSGLLDRHWEDIFAAAELPHDLTLVGIATAIFAVRIMGVFPSHLDMEAFRRPGEVLDRYLGYAEAELDALQ